MDLAVYQYVYQGSIHSEYLTGIAVVLSAVRSLNYAFKIEVMTVANVMEKQDAFQTAAERLTAALDVIEQRFDYFDEFARNGAPQGELTKLQQERSALKTELGEAKLQAHKLATANQDVANRLSTVIKSLQSVLGNA